MKGLETRRLSNSQRGQIHGLCIVRTGPVPSQGMPVEHGKSVVSELWNRLLWSADLHHPYCMLYTFTLFEHSLGIFFFEHILLPSSRRILHSFDDGDGLWSSRKGLAGHHWPSIILLGHFTTCARSSIWLQPDYFVHWFREASSGRADLDLAWEVYKYSFGWFVCGKREILRDYVWWHVENGESSMKTMFHLC